MDPLDLAWLVGILEGEGHFTYQKLYNRIFPKVVIKMTDRDIVYKAKVLMCAGHFSVERRKKDNHKDCYITSLNGEPAIRLMKTILPMMGNRRKERILEVIRMYEEQPPRFERKCGHNGSFVKYGNRTRCLACDRINKRKRLNK